MTADLMIFGFKRRTLPAVAKVPCLKKQKGPIDCRAFVDVRIIESQVIFVHFCFHLKSGFRISTSAFCPLIIVSINLLLSAISMCHASQDRF
jgi:hypothetical protein